MYFQIAARWLGDDWVVGTNELIPKISVVIVDRQEMAVRWLDGWLRYFK